MKKIIHTIAIIIIFFQPFVYAAGIEYQIGVDGVACPFCVYGIEKQLSKLEGIQRIDVDIKNGLVLVMMEDDSSLSEVSIRDAVKNAGFSLRSFTQVERSE